MYFAPLLFSISDQPLIQLKCLENSDISYFYPYSTLYLIASATKYCTIPKNNRTSRWMSKSENRGGGGAFSYS